MTPEEKSPYIEWCEAEGSPGSPRSLAYKAAEDAIKTIHDLRDGDRQLLVLQSIMTELRLLRFEVVQNHASMIDFMDYWRRND